MLEFGYTVVYNNYMGKRLSGKTYRHQGKYRFDDWDDDYAPYVATSPVISSKELAERAVQDDIDNLLRQGVAQPLDDQFYQQFAHFSFQNMPLSQYLQVNNLGECLDCSALLGLAMSQLSLQDFRVCRGVLSRLNASFKTAFNHGWVENQNEVYDTTWKVRIDKDAYYHLFNVQNPTSCSVSKYFANPKIANRLQLTKQQNCDAEMTR